MLKKILSIIAISTFCTCIFALSKSKNQTQQTKLDKEAQKELSRQIKQWIKQHNDDDDVVEEKATWRLYKAGEAAVPQLLKKLLALKWDAIEYSGDEDDRYYARDIIDILEKIGEPPEATLTIIFSSSETYT